ncbi:N-acetyltransferase 8-like [Argonauta hians]
MTDTTDKHTIRQWSIADSQETWTVVKLGSNNYINLLFKALLFRRSSVLLFSAVMIYILMKTETNITLAKIFGGILCYCACVYFLTYIGFLYYLYGPPLRDISDVAGVYLSDPNNNFWVAVCKDKVVGTIAIVKKDKASFDKNVKKAAWLRRMFVHPDYRRRGIARDLLNSSIEFCRGQGYDAIELITTEVNEQARQLYRQTGFRCVAAKAYKYMYGFISVWTYECIYYL